jgi:ribosomal protein S18 acetylase RimI-like enzyme
MHPTDLVVEPLVDLAQLVALEADAKSDGRVMVSRLVQEWRDGRNRFARAGERVYVARRRERVAGVCGLNVDPFAGSDTIGRVRRLYVAVQDRRKGVGTAVVEHLMADAGATFEWIRLRTNDAAAAEFYEAIGFEPVSGDEHCTHRRRVGARRTVAL